MPNIVVVGAQWGDEGKGKVVDFLSEKADVVVRFQGGHNAGHTLVVDGVVYKLKLLPSGIVRGKPSYIGAGVVVDPWALMEEIAGVEKQGLKVTPEILRIAENATLILPFHRYFDAMLENSMGNGKIGTTKRGIGPAYMDNRGRFAIKAGQLFDEAGLEIMVDRFVAFHGNLQKGSNCPREVDRNEILKKLHEIAPKIKPFLSNVPFDLEREAKEGKNILFEGAQGAMLDNDFGTYPFVTSSNTGTAQAATGSGFNMGDIDYSLGLAKAYTTRVGEGPFPTEIHEDDEDNDIAELLVNKGHEFGTNTGRQRRCGWLDAVLVRYATVVCGINALVVTKLDILDDLDKIKICVGYELDGKKIDNFPYHMSGQENVKPVYKEVEGWKSSTASMRSLEQLPEKAVDYLQLVEDLVGKPIAMISTSPEREDMIVVPNREAELAVHPARARQHKKIKEIYNSLKADRGREL